MIISNANSCDNNITEETKNQENNKFEYVYRHIRLDTNMPFYIGISTTDNGKYERAYSRDRSDEWNEVVDNTEYRVEILLKDVPVSILGDKEKYFIKLYGRVDLGTGTLVNKTSGGQGCHGTLTTEESKEKRRNTNLERYGVECPLLSDSVASKTRETNLKKYGVEDARSSEYVIEKRNKTNIIRYGTESSVGYDLINKKRKNSFLEKYGVENVLLLEEVRDKVKKTNLENMDLRMPVNRNRLERKLAINVKVNQCLRRLKKICVTHHTVNQWDNIRTVFL